MLKFVRAPSGDQRFLLTSQPRLPRSIKHADEAFGAHDDRSC